VVLVGRWASMPRRDVARLVRQHGGVVLQRPDASADLIVVGEEDLALAEGLDREPWYDRRIQGAVDDGRLEVITETAFWQRLGMVEAEQGAHRLYTPAMLAELAGVPVAVVRRWHRRGLIRPVRQVLRLPYFDFQEVTTARRLAELLAAGMSPRAIEKKLKGLGRLLPGVERPLAQLAVIVEGRDILLRQGEGLVEPGGQMRFDFQAARAVEGPSETGSGAQPVLPLPEGRGDERESPTLSELCRVAEALEESGDLTGAAEMYRAAMAAGGPAPEICFQLAELLYRMGDTGGARERYYMAIELDEDYVEARANLGCLLAEQGQYELAVAAFQGALAYHPDYADVHYHLASLLDQLGRREEAEGHWEAFLRVAPDSPWSHRARTRLSRPDS